MRYNLESFQNPGGQWRFGSLSNFLQGIGDSYEAGLPQAITPREFRQTLVGGYLQDDWRFRSNLTLNLGLRYEMRRGSDLWGPSAAGHNLRQRWPLLVKPNAS